MAKKGVRQQTNLAADTNFTDKLDEMEALLLEEMRRLNDPYRLWDQPKDGLIQPTSKPQPQRNSEKTRNRKGRQSRPEQPINQ